MSYVKNKFYLFFLIYFLSGCTGEQPKHEREQNNKLTLNISGGEFENTVLNLDPTFANYGEDNDHFLLGFIAVVDNDTTVFNLMFKGQSPGVFLIERNDTTEGGFGNGFSFIRWIGNEKPGSRYFIISESGEINIEKLGNAGEEIVGSFKGYAYDIKFEVPKDSFYIEGTFSAIRGEEKVALY